MSVWHELVIQGPEKTLRGFIAGLEAGLARRLGLVMGSDLDLEKESIVGLLRELFTSGSHHLVLAQVEASQTLAQAIQEHGATVNLEILRRRLVDSAHFGFSFEVFSRELAGRIRDALEHTLPEGVKVVGLKEAERLEPGARGSELYAPAHDYVCRAEGRLEGPLPGILEMRRRAATLDFVTVEPLALSATAITPGPVA